VNFLRNLDELDLERLTDAEREDVYRAFAPELSMRIFGRGIRRRLAPMLGSRPRLEMAFSLLFSLPGIPMLIYGDEIGMGDDLSLEERNAVRTPMQWSPEGQAGFSTGKHDPLSRPVISKGPYSCTHVNVADQARDPGSLLNWFKSLIVARRHCPQWGWSEAEVLETGEPSVLAHRCHWKNEAVIAVHNLGDQSRSVKIHLAGVTGPLVRILGNASEQVHEDMLVLDLTPYAYGWYRIEQHERSKGGGS
jgi:maltose alpha-D-glucosyltransferase/alpha-amylase